MGAYGSKDSSPTTSQCPVPEAARHSRAVYNVYNQRIDGCPQMVSASSCPGLSTRSAHSHACCMPQDPRNNMPLQPNQQPFPGQRRPISTERQQSSIPKGGTDESWVYPSPQMFYNGARLFCQHAIAHPTEDSPAWPVRSPKA
jgi:cytochrome c heme-lyase